MAAFSAFCYTWLQKSFGGKFCIILLFPFVVNICDVLRDLVPFVQFKKRVAFNKVAG